MIGTIYSNALALTKTWIGTKQFSATLIDHLWLLVKQKYAWQNNLCVVWIATELALPMHYHVGYYGF